MSLFIPNAGLVQSVKKIPVLSVREEDLGYFSLVLSFYRPAAF